MVIAVSAVGGLRAGNRLRETGLSTLRFSKSRVSSQKFPKNSLKPQYNLLSQAEKYQAAQKRFSAHSPMSQGSNGCFGCMRKFQVLPTSPSGVITLLHGIAPFFPN